MAEEVHSTAAENAVTRQDKFGHSMPILKPMSDRPGGYEVHHGDIHKGNIYNYRERWYAVRNDVPFDSSQPLESKHHAAAWLFDPMDPATYGERHR